MDFEFTDRMKLIQYNPLISNSAKWKNYFILGLIPIHYDTPLPCLTVNPGNWNTCLSGSNFAFPSAHFTLFKWKFIFFLSFFYFFRNIWITFLNKKGCSVLSHYEPLVRSFISKLLTEATHYCFVNKHFEQLVNLSN